MLQRKILRAIILHEKSFFGVRRMKTRKEKDSVGELAIPEEAYYGVQTQRGYNNFQISGTRMNPVFIVYEIA